MCASARRVDGERQILAKILKRRYVVTMLVGQKNGVQGIERLTYFKQSLSERTGAFSRIDEKLLSAAFNKDGIAARTRK